MRLSAMADYALRLLMYLAQRPERLCTIAEVAEAYSISEAHLMKITHQLGQAGFLATLRGRGGGMRLAAPPGEIELGAVVRAMEPDLALVECFDRPGGNRCTLTGQWGLAGILDDALAAFLAQLDGHTLADLAPAAPPAQHLLRRFPQPHPGATA